METRSEENLRRLETQAANLGLSTAELVDLREWKVSDAAAETTLDKVKREKPMVIIGGMSGTSFSKLRNLQSLSDVEEKKTVNTSRV